MSELRIIAGQWRGRKLRFASDSAIRPTPNRVRETLFNWLQPVIEGARCLDLFAGSGALGFEAASRGAHQVTLVDIDEAVCQQIADEIARFDAYHMNVVTSSAESYIAEYSNDNYSDGFDIAFLDPPFSATDRLKPVLEVLVSHPTLLKRGGFVYIESAAGSVVPPDLPWQCQREGRAGDVEYYLYRIDAQTNE